MEDNKRSNRKGYIGRQMSINAKKARDKGMIVKSEINSTLLKELGFNYSVNFFKWLCKKGYIIPKEVHHTSASFRSTVYLDKSSILFAVDKYNLELLYRIYLEKITIQEAKQELHIEYVIIKASDRILGLQGKNIVKISCVMCYGYIFFAKGKYINKDSKEYVILEKTTERTKEYCNKNIKKMVRILLIYNKDFALYILKNIKATKM